MTFCCVNGEGSDYDLIPSGEAPPAINLWCGRFWTYVSGNSIGSRLLNATVQAGMLGVGAVASYFVTDFALNDDENSNEYSWQPLAAAISATAVIVVGSCATEFLRCKNSNRSRRIVPSPCFFSTVIAGSGMTSTYLLMKEYSFTVIEVDSHNIEWSWLEKSTIALVGVTFFYHVGSRILTIRMKRREEPIFIN